VLYADLDFERPPWDTISQDARALVVALLQRDADRRPTAREALSFRHEGTHRGTTTGQPHLAKLNMAAPSLRGSTVELHPPLH